jgi:hypothetical protein
VWPPRSRPRRSCAPQRGSDDSYTQERYTLLFGLDGRSAELQLQLLSYSTPFHGATSATAVLTSLGNLIPNLYVWQCGGGGLWKLVTLSLFGWQWLYSHISLVPWEPFERSFVFFFGDVVVGHGMACFPGGS